MKLYTKAGDDGLTGLFGGERVPKDHPRVVAYGQIDELNASLGVVVCHVESMLVARLRSIQSDLFTIGAELATPKPDERTPRVGDVRIAELERWIDEASDAAPPLRTFVLPGGTIAAAHFHLARTVCRRAERSCVTLSRNETVRPIIIIYLNRLGDLLFAMARAANASAGVADIPWTAPRS